MLDVAGRNAATLRSDLPVLRDQAPRDVVAVTLAAFHGVAGRHALAMVVEQEAGEQAWVLGSTAGIAFDPVRHEHYLCPFPEFLVNDGVVFPRIAFVLVHDLAAIDPILQHQVERAPRERLAA